MLVVLLLLTGVYCGHGRPLTWQQISAISTEKPQERFGHALGYYNNLLVVYGGLRGGTYLRDTWTFNLNTSVWEEIETDVDKAPPARAHCTFGVLRTQGLFIVAYGIGPSSIYYNDVWSLDLKTLSSAVNPEWKKITVSGDIPIARSGSFGGVFNTEAADDFWLGGGYSPTPDSLHPTHNIDVYKLTSLDNFATGTWERLYDNPTVANQFNPDLPHGRFHATSAIVTATNIAIYGGCLSGDRGGGPCPSEDAWSFDSNSRVWSQLSMCPTPRVLGAMVPLPGTAKAGQALLFGGTEQSAAITGSLVSVTKYQTPEVYVLDINGAADTQWKHLQTQSDSQGLFPGRRYGHAMAVTETGTIYLFGGKLVDIDTEALGLWTLSGEVDDTPLLSPGCERKWFSYVHLHGTFMALVWGILLPLGILIARYYRFFGKSWMYIHAIIQIFSVLIGLTGFVMIFPTVYDPTPNHPHAIIGIVLMILSLIQPIGGIFRPHLKTGRRNKGGRRICWEIFHKCLGILILLLGFTQITLGVFLSVPPLVVWAVWIGVLGLWIVTFIVHEVGKWIHYIIKRKRNSKDRVEDYAHEMKHNKN